MEKILRYLSILLGVSFAFCQAMDLNLGQEQQRIGLPDILIEVLIPNSNKVLVAYQKYKLAVVYLKDNKVVIKKIGFDCFNQHGDLYRKNWAREAVFQSTIQDVQISLDGRFAAILFEKEHSKYIVMVDILYGQDCCLSTYFQEIDVLNFKSMHFTPDNHFFIIKLKNGISNYYQISDGRCFVLVRKVLADY